jgi:hypothetical protein
VFEVGQVELDLRSTVDQWTVTLYRRSATGRPVTLEA